MVEDIMSSAYESLSISWDGDSVNPTPDEGYPVLYISIQDDQHYHIKLRNKEAIKLRNWLTKFLELKGID